MKITRINGYNVGIKRISNYSLYAKIIQSEEFQSLREPSVPKVWNEKRKTYLENPFSPVYAQELEFFEVAKNALIVEILLLECVEIDLNTISDKTLNKLRRTKINNNLSLAVLKYEVLKTASDINILIKQILLTESLVYDYMQLISITRNGIDILTHNLRNPVNTTIQISPITIGAYELVNPLHEYTACIESGLNWESWLTNKYELEIMAYTIAMYRLNKLIEIHSNDEQQKG